MNLGNCINVFDSLKNVEEGGIGDFFIELNLTPDECQKFCHAITEMSNKIGYGTIEKLTGGGPITWRKAFIMYLAVLAAAVDAGRCAGKPDKKACKFHKGIAAEKLLLTSMAEKTSASNARTAASNAAAAKSDLDASIDTSSIAHRVQKALNENKKDGALTELDIANFNSQAAKLDIQRAIDTALGHRTLARINRQNMAETGLFWSAMIIAGTLLMVSLNGIRKLALPQQIYNTFGIATGQHGQPVPMQGGPAFLQAGPPALIGPPLAAIQAPVTGFVQTYPQMAVVNVPYNDILPGFNQILQVNPDIKHPLVDGQYSNAPMMNSDEVYNASRNGYRVYVKDPHTQNMYQIQTIPQLMQSYANGYDVHIRWSSQVLGGHRYKKSHKQTRNKRKQSRNKRKQSRNQHK